MLFLIYIAPQACSLSNVYKPVSQLNQLPLHQIRTCFVFLNQWELGKEVESMFDFFLKPSMRQTCWAQAGTDSWLA